MIEESRVFGTQKNQKHGVFNTLRYHLRAERETDKRFPIMQCALIVPVILQTFLRTLLPSEVVRGLEGGWSLERLVLWLVLLAVLLWVCNAAVGILEHYMALMGDFAKVHYEEKVIRKMMYLDYDVMEREQTLSGNVWKAIRKGDDFEKSAATLPRIALSFLGMIFCGILIIQKNALLLIPSLIAVVLKSRLITLVRRKHGEKHALLTGYVKETAYISRQSRESSAGKDIRIYRMTGLFLAKYNEALKAMDRIFHTIHLWYLLNGVISNSISFAMDCFVYLYPVYMVINGSLSISSFVLYIGLMRDFYSYFSVVNDSLMTLNPFFASVNAIREFLELKDRWPKRDRLGAQKMAQLKKKGVKLELKDVSYTYAGKEEPALSHINLTVRPGEKLALLGLNGAGKTTMVKLICGFYEPDEGEILLNDVPVGDYDRDDYYELISVLFQDSTMLPFTLDENLTGQQGEAVRRERLDRAMELSGFAKKYHSLTDKGDSLLIKEESGMADNVFDVFLAKAGSIPGIRIDRNEYLRKAFGRKHREVQDDIVSRGPLAAGISKREVSLIADQAIYAEAFQTTLVSAGAGVFGGFAVLAAVPADIVQFYGHVFRVMQKLMYLYGWESDIFDGDGNIDDTTKNVLILYMGVMFGIGMVSQVIAQITRQAAKRLLRDVPAHVLKDFFTKQAARELIKKIVKAVGVKTAAKMTVSSGSKIVPVIGAVTSGAFTAAFFLPMTKRLKKQLADGQVFDDDEENV